MAGRSFVVNPCLWSIIGFFQGSRVQSSMCQLFRDLKARATQSGGQCSPVKRRTKKARDFHVLPESTSQV